MAPNGAPGVHVIHWTEAISLPEPGDVAIEAFGCDPPAGFVAAMAQRARPPVWINLEYLSAESYVERSHRLPSPQQTGPGAGLVKWFFYPGFTPATGGLLREPWLAEAQARFDPGRWLADQGIQPLEGERLVSLFCYANPELPGLLERLGDAPTLLLTAPGPATEGLAALRTPPTVRVQALPWLTQSDYDRLLWSCSLNLVRGEDSFVRAQWAGAPFMWHIYPQHDEAHAAKLDAFLGRHLAGAEPGLAEGIRAFMLAWNGLGPWPVRLPDWSEWSAHARRWRDALLGQQDLATQLLNSIAEKR
jgi:uncharacterized repeat protein (TIGR03837 family)